jgi:hypothetical protein
MLGALCGTSILSGLLFSGMFCFGNALFGTFEKETEKK